MPDEDRRCHLKLGVASALAFVSGWADALGIVRFQTFVGQMTGNVVFFGLSIAPSQIRDRAGVANVPALYIGVIASNVMGALIFRILQRSTDWPGVSVAVITLILGLVGDFLYSFTTPSPWFALLYAPIFGAVNTLTSSPPLSASTVTMTANLQKLPSCLLACVDQRQFTRPDIGAIMPIPALAGSVASSALLWTDDQNFYSRWYSSMPIILSLAALLIVHDLCLVELASTTGLEPMACRARGTAAEPSARDSLADDPTRQAQIQLIDQPEHSFADESTPLSLRVQNALSSEASPGAGVGRSPSALTGASTGTGAGR